MQNQHTMELIVWSLRTLYLHACQVRVIAGDSGLNRRFPEITGKDNLTVFLLQESEVPCMEAAAEKSRSATVLDLQAWTYYNLY